MKVISVTDSEAVVEQSGISKRARTDLLPEIAVGDYVLIHAGFAIARLQEDDALETLSRFRETGL